MSEEIVLNRREGVVAAQDIHLNRSVYSEPYPYDIHEVHNNHQKVAISGSILPHPELVVPIEQIVSSLNPSASYDVIVEYREVNMEPIKEASVVPLTPTATFSITVEYEEINVEELATSVTHSLKAAAYYELRQTVEQVEIAADEILVKNKGTVNGIIKPNS